MNKHNQRILYVHTGEVPQNALARVADAMQMLGQGQVPEPRFELGFESMQQLLAVFTPKRWDLLAVLREAGPQSIMSLARRLQRDYKNVHTDVAVLLKWGVIEKTEQQLIIAPFDEIKMDVLLPQRKAA